MRVFRLLSAASAGVLLALMAARSGLRQLPRPTPETAPTWLAVEQRWALNPERRRQAALLRSSRVQDDPGRWHALLANQGWGRGPLAAVTLKQQAQAATALGQQGRADQLWRHLIGQQADQAASADGLYMLGRRQPQWRRTLLQRWPAHPAALAAASELGGGQPNREGALHLARWGARWPGAAAKLSAACQLHNTRAAQRQQLAQGLAELGLERQALACLGNTPALPATQLLLARSGLAGAPADQAMAVARLLALIQRHPESTQASEAVRLIAAEDSPAARQALQQLPRSWQTSAAVQASLARQAAGNAATLAVLQRWPRDPASWELQWQRARTSALTGNWRDTQRLLQAGGPALEASMPAALQARRLFWLGLSQWQLGQATAARSQWQRVRRLWPGGYYGWRAATRLIPGEAHMGLAGPAHGPTPSSRWNPLDSGSTAVDLLWRLGQPLEAWELWRTHRRGRPPSGSRDLQAEGRLREAVGDGWLGLGMQEAASLQLPPAQCRLQQLIERTLHQPRQLAPLARAAAAHGLPLPLLLGVAKQESRFQSTVGSVMGAQGLLQLMPDTAAEVAGQPLTPEQLQEPDRNADLGARYLQGLLRRWSGNALLAVASYNAGPNAVQDWINPSLQSIPELWVESIPYPETRHYVKAVLGNSWSFAAPRLPSCR